MAVFPVPQDRSVGEPVAAVGHALGLALPGPGARVVTARVGPWNPASAEHLHRGRFPLLVVEGALLRTVSLRSRDGACLLGAGDVLGLEPEEGAFETRFRVLTPCTLAVLEPRVMAALATQPPLVAALEAAAVRRAGMLAGQVVLAQLVAIDDRLRILLPTLAERWGRVTADGVVLPAFLSHTVLAALVGARRPSLTAAVGRLVEVDALRRLPDRRWLLGAELGAVAA
jgi:CRP/FNR family transcriptional regulator, cyclic AMP receptor protein